MNTEKSEWIRREEFRYFIQVPTRWGDNDQFGHLNNVIYLRLFEALVVQYLSDAGLDWMKDPVIPYAAENQCRFRRAVSFPDMLDMGLRVARLGNSSITYAMAMFRQGEDEAAATCRWVHVYVDRKTEASCPIPEQIRRVMERDL